MIRLPGKSSFCSDKSSGCRKRMIDYKCSSSKKRVWNKRRKRGSARLNPRFIKWQGKSQGHYLKMLRKKRKNQLLNSSSHQNFSESRYSEVVLASPRKLIESCQRERLTERIEWKRDLWSGIRNRKRSWYIRHIDLVLKEIRSVRLSQKLMQEHLIQKVLRVSQKHPEKWNSTRSYF
jgi:hypothetical protein